MNNVVINLGDKVIILFFLDGKDLFNNNNE